MANEVMTKEEQEQTDKMQSFLKEAFCVDGYCLYVEDVKVIATFKTNASAMFALGDSKRGVFYVTISK